MGLKKTAFDAPLLLQLDGVHSSYSADSGSRDRVNQGGAGSSRGGTASRVKESTGGMAIKVGAISGGNKATAVPKLVLPPGRKVLEEDAKTRIP